MNRMNAEARVACGHYAPPRGKADHRIRERRKGAVRGPGFVGGEKQSVVVR